MGASTARTTSQAAPRRRQSNVPHGTESIPRFAPSAAELGAACAQQILEEFRKGIDGVDLKAGSADASKRQTRK